MPRAAGPYVFRIERTYWPDGRDQPPAVVVSWFEKTHRVLRLETYDPASARTFRITRDAVAAKRRYYPYTMGKNVTIQRLEEALAEYKARKGQD